MLKNSYHFVSNEQIVGQGVDNVGSLAKEYLTCDMRFKVMSIEIFFSRISRFKVQNTQLNVRNVFPFCPRS